MRHAVHGVVRLDLGGGELGHVGHLVHLLGEGLLGEQHLGLLVGLLRLAVLEELSRGGALAGFPGSWGALPAGATYILDLLLQDRVLLGCLLSLAPGLFRLELERGVSFDGLTVGAHPPGVERRILRGAKSYPGLELDLHVAGLLSLAHRDGRLLVCMDALSVVAGSRGARKVASEGNMFVWSICPFVFGVGESRKSLKTMVRRVRVR